MKKIATTKYCNLNCETNLAKSEANFRLKLEQLVKTSGKKRGRVAKEAGFSASQLNGWLSGENVPGIDALDRIAEYFGTSAVTLISGGQLPPVPKRIETVREPTAGELAKRVKAALEILESWPFLAHGLSRQQSRLLDRLPTVDDDEIEDFLDGLDLADSALRAAESDGDEGEGSAS